MRNVNVNLLQNSQLRETAVIVSVLYLLQYFRFSFCTVLKLETQLKLIIMSDSIISKMEQKNNEKSNVTQQSEHQELSEQVLSILKGKRASLCKEVLIGLIRHEIDKKSTVN